MGLKRVLGESLRTIAHVEIEAYAVANLVAKMETGQMDVAPIWTDVKTFPYGDFYKKVDILTGGYPCQPFSMAGKRKGKDDPRHIWPYIAGAIKSVRPRFCFFENVEGHVTEGLKDVLHDLGELGYRTTCGLFTAAECGAPHRRGRIFILANARDTESNWIPEFRQPENFETRNTSQLAYPEKFQGSVELANRHSGRGGKNTKPSELRSNFPFKPSCNSRTSKPIQGDQRREDCWPARPGEPQHEWEPAQTLGNNKGRNRKPNSTIKAGFELHRVPSEQGKPRQTQPRLGGNAHGPLYQVDRLRLLGNGVVPPQAELAFRTLYRELMEE